MSIDWLWRVGDGVVDGVVVWVFLLVGMWLSLVGWVGLKKCFWVNGIIRIRFGKKFVVLFVVKFLIVNGVNLV